MQKLKIYPVIGLLFVFICSQSMGQNPFITDQFTADPSARVFNGKVYVYPSHDIPCTEGKGRVGWFCMEDYHVFSSENLTDWTDHGVIVSQTKVPWVNPTSYSMWAPDCIYRNGKYYFYFPSTLKDTTQGRGFSIGVAVADKPEGPYEVSPDPIKGVRGIDPNILIDKDGQAYLYWSLRHIYVAKLKDNMMELDSEPYIIKELPDKGLKEGPWVFERNGIYYMTYPHVENEVERLEYAIGDNPMGPFEFAGVIMDESPTGCWTNHHSIMEYQNQWYLFYHHNDLSPNFDKNRSIRVDSLFFNQDGTIQKVIPTLRGVGIVSATREIQLDRFSQMSGEGASIDFLDTLNRFQGWKTILEKNNSWVQFNRVDFGKKKLKSISVKAQSPQGSTIHVKLNGANGPVIAKVDIPAGKKWNTIKVPVSNIKTGVQDLVVSLASTNSVEVDWVKFE